MKEGTAERPAIRQSRSQATRANILQAAKTLFSEKGYDAVTMREIAARANCSHTAIYMHFKDKRALLGAIALPPLERLKGDLEQALRHPDRSADDRLTDVGLLFIRFCLENRNLVPLLFLTEAVRVDEPEPELAINRLRNATFGLLARGLSECLGIGPDDPRLLTFSRIAFFSLFGIVGTYLQGEESADRLFRRLRGTFEETVNVLLAGFRARCRTNTAGKEGDHED